jgi:biopolymer transport protein ExbB
MKQSVFITVLLISALVVSTVIYFYLLPKFIQDGGYLVILLIALSIMVVTFIIERTLSLRRAEGKGSLQRFLKEVVQQVQSGKIEAAISWEPSPVINTIFNRRRFHPRHTDRNKRSV